MAARMNAFIRGLGGMFSWVDVLNRRLFAETSAEAEAEALREVWEDVGGHLYDAMGALPPSGSNSARQVIRGQTTVGYTKREHFALRRRAMDLSRPLPPPEILRAYEELMPGSVDRILALAEKQQKNRAIFESSRAIVAFLSMLILLGLSAYLVSVGLDAVGLAVVSGSVAIAAGTFIYEKRARHRTLMRRR